MRDAINIIMHSRNFSDYLSICWAPIGRKHTAENFQNFRKINKSTNPAHAPTDTEHPTGYANQFHSPPINHVILHPPSIKTIYHERPRRKSKPPRRRARWRRQRAYTIPERPKPIKVAGFRIAARAAPRRLCAPRAFRRGCRPRSLPWKVPIYAARPEFPGRTAGGISCHGPTRANMLKARRNWCPAILWSVCVGVWGEVSVPLDGLKFFVCQEQGLYHSRVFFKWNDYSWNI